MALSDMDVNAAMGLTSMSNVVMGHFKTNNLVLDYILNFTILGVIGFVTTQLLPQMKGWLLSGSSSCFNRRNLRPTIKFVAKKINSSWQTGISSSTEYRAWLAKIRELIMTRTRDGKSAGLYQLQEFHAVHSLYEDDESTKKDYKKTEWQPDQNDDFLIADKIFCSFSTTRVEEPRGDRNENVWVFTLEVYTKHKNEFGLLLNYHEALMKDYHEKAKLSLNTKPHIFELQGTDEESGNVVWDMFKFSSTRQMEHVWFKQKDAFLKAYENFLNNRAGYEARGDPYTFSCLLYGSPGCGKTSIIKAIVNDSIRRGRMAHVFIVSFSKIKNGNMLSRVIFEEEVNGHHIPFDQRVIIFEDFDADDGAKVFKKRFKKNSAELSPLPPLTLKRGNSEPNVRLEGSEMLAESSGMKDLGVLGPLALDAKKDDKLTLSAVLNVLDGINERTGQRCFWTTNATPPEDHFDAAFLRPGRMDMMIDFTKCDQAGISYLLKAYFGTECSVPNSELALVADYKWSPAEVKQKCKESSGVRDALNLLIITEPQNH